MATRAAILGWPGPWWTSPALIDGLLGYAVAMAVGVAVFSRASDGQPSPWPAYVFALNFGLILLIREISGAGDDHHLARHLRVSIDRRNLDTPPVRRARRS